MESINRVVIFLDDETTPIGEYPVPLNFELDTTKLVDGEHTLRIVSKDLSGKEGIRLIPFQVRNGPAIDVEGISEHATLNGKVPIMINAYSKGNQRQFLIDGSETPKSIPSLFWAAIITFGAWAIYYLIDSLIL